MKTSKLIKITKIILVITLALYFTLVVFGNLTDYGTNYLFVEHVLKMDTTFNSPNIMWKAIENPICFHGVYWIIILTEIFTLICLWKGGVLFANKSKLKQEKGKKNIIIGLLLSMLIWFFYFITIGGEWFSMWQSETWNGLDAAFRMFVISGIIFIMFLHKEK